MSWQIVKDTKLVAAFVLGGGILEALDLNPGSPVVTFAGGTEPVGLASVVPYIDTSSIVHRPFPVPPPLPVTTLFILNGTIDASVLTVSPSLLETAKVNTAFSLNKAQPQRNGLAVYQKAIPANAIYIGPPLPIFVFVLCSGEDGGETVFRYQMNSDPPYQPAGLGTAGTDPTFIGGNSTVSGVKVLTTSAAIQGLACGGEGTLAVSDGPVIWLFDAETGVLKDQITLTAWGNLAAFTLSFGPDGNLYVLAGPPLRDPAQNSPQSITILKFLASTAVAVGVKGSSGNPVLITAAQLNGNQNIAMTVGGTSTAPIVYIGGTDPKYLEPNILTFDGVTGNPTANSFPTLGIETNVPYSFAVVDTYTLKESFPVPRPIV